MSASTKAYPDLRVVSGASPLTGGTTPHARRSPWNPPSPPPPAPSAAATRSCGGITLNSPSSPTRLFGGCASCAPRTTSATWSPLSRLRASPSASGWRRSCSLRRRQVAPMRPNATGRPPGRPDNRPDQSSPRTADLAPKAMSAAMVRQQRPAGQRPGLAVTCRVSLLVPADCRTRWWYLATCPVCHAPHLGRAKELTDVTGKRKLPCKHLVDIVVARTYGRTDSGAAA